jgi:hypothetical protein
LAIRLHNKQPTFFHFKEDVVIFFDEGGVRLLSPECSVSNVPAHPSSWVLVDLNTSVESVPGIFVEDDHHYFVVVAASPHPGRWESMTRTRHNIKFKLWFMEPPTLEELIQMSVFAGFSSSVTHSLDILVVNFKVPNPESETPKHFSRSMAHRPVNASSGVSTSTSTIMIK